MAVGRDAKGIYRGGGATLLIKKASRIRTYWNALVFSRRLSGRVTAGSVLSGPTTDSNSGATYSPTVSGRCMVISGRYGVITIKNS